MDTKPFYTSKTLAFNAVAVAVFVASVFGFADFAPDPDVMALVAVAVNLALRFVTSKKVTLKAS